MVNRGREQPALHRMAWDAPRQVIKKLRLSLGEKNGLVSHSIVGALGVPWVVNWE